MFGNSVSVIVSPHPGTLRLIPLSSSTFGGVVAFGSNFRADMVIESVNQTLPRLCSHIATHEMICYSKNAVIHGQDLVALSVFPTSGSVSGGTRVVFRNIQLPNKNGSSLICRFGDKISPSSFQYELNEVVCVSPPSAVSGRVSLHLDLIEASAKDTVVTLANFIFSYVPRAHAFALRPLNVIEGSRGRVRVFGIEFIGSGTLYCRVGNVSALADWQSPSLLFC